MKCTKHHDIDQIYTEINYKCETDVQTYRSFDQKQNLAQTHNNKMSHVYQMHILTNLIDHKHCSCRKHRLERQDS